MINNFRKYFKGIPADKYTQLVSLFYRAECAWELPLFGKACDNMEQVAVEAARTPETREKYLAYIQTLRELGPVFSLAWSALFGAWMRMFCSTRCVNRLRV